MAWQANSERRSQRSGWKALGKRVRSHFWPAALSPGNAGSPFATHLPVLIGLSFAVRLRRVLELGAGVYSTRLFLNRAVFPTLEVLHSYENHHYWYNQVLPSVQQAPRATLTMCEGPMSTAVSSMSLEDYDLILIDDSQTLQERCHTIQAVATSSKMIKLCVIHDYNNKEYRHAAKRFSCRFRLDALHPETGVCWRDGELTRAQLVGINNCLARHARSTAAGAIEEWLAAFRGA